MITFPVPHKSRFQPADVDFSALLAAGQYNFGTSVNTNVDIILMEPNLIYLIDSFSFSGNMADETFMSVIVNVPTLIISRKNDQQNVYAAPIRLRQFNPVFPCSIFAISNRKNDVLQASLSGLLNQNPDLIGVDPIHLSITWNIQAIEEGEYNRVFRNKINPSYSMRLDQ